MSNRIKDIMADIPLPPELHERTKAGVAKAMAEQPRFPAAASGWQRKRRRLIALAACLLLLLSGALMSSEVRAAIQKALQFIPGIGLVQEGEKMAAAYILPDPVITAVGKGEIRVSGVMIKEDSAYLTLSGRGVAHPEQVTLINGEGTAYPIKRSRVVGGGGEWAADYWLQGKVAVTGDIQLQVDMAPGGTGEPLTLPLKLLRAESYASYRDMGETAEVNGISITAIARRFGTEGRITLVSEPLSTPEAFFISDYGVAFAPFREGYKLKVTDGAGKDLPLTAGKGISAPEQEFYYPLGTQQGGVYRMTIPEIQLYATKSATKMTLPVETRADYNKDTTLAGFPLRITRLEKIDNRLRMYVEYPQDDKHPGWQLSRFGLEKDAGDFNEKLSGLGKIKESTGEQEWFEFEVTPGKDQVEVILTDAVVRVSGPWTFELPYATYFNE